MSHTGRVTCIVVALCLAAIGSLGVSIDAADAQYVLAEKWAPPPAGMEWGEVSAVATDPAKTKIYVLRRHDPPMFELDPSGKILRSWGDKMFVWPHGMRVDREGFLWITDGRAAEGKGHQVFKLSPDGRVMLTLGTAGIAGDGPDTFNGPADVALAANGDIFVADGHGNSRVVKFSKEGKFIKAWGTKGEAPGEFNVPHTIAMDSRGRLFVGDRSNNRIQIFDQEGRFLEQWTQFGGPSGILIASDDTMYIAGPKQRIAIGSAKDGTVTGFIEQARGESLTLDGRGDLYAADPIEPPHSLRKYIKK